MVAADVVELLRQVIRFPPRSMLEAQELEGRLLRGCTVRFRKSRTSSKPSPSTSQQIALIPTSSATRASVQLLVRRSTSLTNTRTAFTTCP